MGEDTKLSLQYTYDGESKLTSVTDEKGSKIVGYGYDTDGNLAKRTVDGNGMTTNYVYDYQNHLTSLKNQTKSAGVISEYTSEYLTNGQKSKETADTMDEDGKKSKKTSTYVYDLLGRITKETKTGSEDISYTYDSNNNRKETTVGNKVTAYKYNKNDELLRTDTLNTDTEEDAVVIYKNDKNGNQLATVNRYEISSDKKDSTYVDIDVTLGDNRLNENVVNHYNALNQLTQTLTKNYKVSFTYDAEGFRTSKTVNGEKTVFVWDGDQLVMELSESGKVQKRYIRGNDLVYADKGTDTEKQYYVTDPHGNVVQLTDESGAVIKTYEYDSFGNEVNPDRKDENPFRYCGEYYDKETEEIYLRARYYQPNVGRFLTRDSYTGESDEPLSLHLYTYCENDGINSVDPSGHKKYAKEEPLAGLSVWLDKYINSDLGKENKKVIQVQNSKNKKVKNKKKINTPLYNKHKVLLKKVKSNNLFNSTLNKFGKKYTKNKKKYKNISKRTKLPPQLIAAIHYRESSCNFKTYLHNGDPLGKPTIHVPKGIYFEKFTDAAVDALKEKNKFRKKYKLKADSKDMAAMLSFAEVYNGLGYFNKGVVSPYIYSGTNLYKKGKFVSDGSYNASVTDKQPGVYILIKKII